MTTLALAAALVTLTYGGEIHIQENLTPEVCEQGKSIALYGETVEARAEREKAEAEAAKKWAEKHPDPCADSKTITCLSSQSFVSIGRAVSPGDIKLAVCVK